jgi:hypothetical protein
LHPVTPADLADIDLNIPVPSLVEDAALDGNGIALVAAAARMARLLVYQKRLPTCVRFEVSLCRPAVTRREITSVWASAAQIVTQLYFKRRGLREARSALGRVAVAAF